MEKVKAANAGYDSKSEKNRTDAIEGSGAHGYAAFFFIFKRFHAFG